MEDYIIDAVSYLMEKRKRPSMEEIYNHIKRKYEYITMDSYKEVFDQLEKDDKIIKRKDRDSYYISSNVENHREHSVNRDENTSFTGHENYDDGDLINMIKNSMMDEKVRNEEHRLFLMDEITFLRSELKHKNDVISDLLSLLKQHKHSNENVETRLNNVCTENKISTPTINRNTHNTEINYNQKGNKDNDIKQPPIIEVIGDSHLNAINPKGLSKHNNVIVRNHPGSTTEDLKSFIVPTIKKKRDVIVIHSGANDLTNDVDTIENLNTIVNRIKRTSAETKIAISSVFIRKDQRDIERKVRELNVNLKRFCDENLITFLCNDNIDESCLGVKKLHLNKKGSSIFARNLINFMESLY